MARPPQDEPADNLPTHTPAQQSPTVWFGERSGFWHPHPDPTCRSCSLTHSHFLSGPTCQPPTPKSGHCSQAAAGALTATVPSMPAQAPVPALTELTVCRGEGGRGGGAADSESDKAHNGIHAGCRDRGEGGRETGGAQRQREKRRHGEGDKKSGRGGGFPEETPLELGLDGRVGVRQVKKGGKGVPDRGNLAHLLPPPHANKSLRSQTSWDGHFGSPTASPARRAPTSSQVAAAAVLQTVLPQAGKCWRR